MLAIKLTEGGLPGRECSWLDYFLNLIFINGFIGTPYVDGAHWYLTTLLALIAVFAMIRKLKIDTSFFTYVIWLALIMLFYKSGFIAIAGLGGGAYLGAAMVGVSIAWIMNDTQNRLLWFSLLFLGVFYSAYVQGISWIAYNIFSAGLLSLCIKEKMKIFNCRIFQLIGKVSYPWYLIHQNLAYLLIIRMENSGGGYSVIYSFIALIITFVIAIGIWMLDKKFISNKKKRRYNVKEFGRSRK